MEGKLLCTYSGGRSAQTVARFFAAKFFESPRKASKPYRGVFHIDGDPHCYSVAILDEHDKVWGIWRESSLEDSAPGPKD